MPAIFSLSLGADEFAFRPSTWLGTINAADAAAALPTNCLREIEQVGFIEVLQKRCKV
jgi:hypothetical protein